MKRGLLIGAGTLGSLGAVLAITPPNFGSANSAGAALGSSSTGASNAAATTTTASTATASTPTPAAATPTPAATKATAAATKKATTAATKKATASTTKKATATPSATKSTAPAASATPTPAVTKTTAPAASSGASGTFTGASYQANEYGRIWGNVSVTVTLKNGVITSSVGSQNPSSRGYFAFSQIDPYVSAQKISVATIKSTAATALPYVSGATYSSIAYWDSLKSALNKAGI